MVRKEAYEKFQQPYDPAAQLVYCEWRGKLEIPDPIFYSEIEQRIQKRRVPSPIDRWGTGDGGEVITRIYRGRKYDVIERLWIHGGVGVGRRLEVIWND